MDIFLESPVVQCKLSKSQLKNKKYSVRLYISVKGRVYSITQNPRIQLTLEEWKKLNTNRYLDSRLKIIREEIKKRERRAYVILEQEHMNPFDIKSFREVYLHGHLKKRRRKTFVSFVREVIQADWEAERFSSADITRDALASFLRFDKKIDFEKIDIDYLKKYENSIVLSPSTKGMYIAVMRRLINKAIEQGLYNKARYPFGKGKYCLPAGRKKKRAIDLSTLITFLNAKPTLTAEQWAHDLWTFSFYSNGMNLKDVFNLRFSDIQGDFLFFSREKTKRTKRGEQEPIAVYLNQVCKDIINKWGNKRNAAYIFNVLSENMDAEEQYYACKNAIKRMNYNLRKLCRRLNLGVVLTTYAARHSWGTTLERGGIPLSFIKQGYGHSSIVTTEHYLAGFTSDQMKNVADWLLKLTKK